ncbi:Tn3 family transposase [Francisella sp. SYW-2]|uniref:Tn3 family transposase n=1 Tax=Francisella sp. SYW-2 TaxID=2610886 RepID=UPI00123CF3F9|nr:Tn3 family transposase [Francisella sp. SYW-2]
MARLKILSADDFDNLYTIPKIEKQDREFLFELDEYDNEYLNTLTDLSSKIDYILQMEYFRISQYFFNFTIHGVRQDSWHIIETYYPGSKFPKKATSKHYVYQNRKVILKKYEMFSYNSSFRKKLETYAKDLARQHIVPKYIFDSLLDFCHQNRFVRPSYSVLQEIISEALNNEKNRLSNKLYRLMDKPFRDDLQTLLEKDDDYYQLTIIKKDQKDFATKDINSTVEKHQFLANIYKNSLKIIKQLDLSEQNILYYAELAEYHTIYGLRHMSKKNLARLYLICYAYHRFQKISDYLIFSFSHKVNSYLSDGEEHQVKAYENYLDSETKARNSVADILSLFYNKKVADNQIRDKAFEIIPKHLFPNFTRNFRKPKFNAEFYRWEYYAESAGSIKKNIRGSFKAIDFQSENKHLAEAINFFKEHLKSNKSFKDYDFNEVKISFVPRNLRRYIIEKVRIKGSSKKAKKINGDRYEFMLYMQIEKHISNGTVTVIDSLSYKSLKDELIPNDQWKNNKLNLIKKLKNKLLQTDIGIILKEFEKELSNRYHTTNKNINDGSNQKIKIKYNKKGEILSWRLPYKKVDDGVNNPFYENLDTVSISDIISHTIKESGFIKKFTHILPSYSKNKANESAISACIVAKGTGSDIHRMKDISNIKQSELESASKNFLRIKTLSEANDVVMNKVEKLPIFEKYTLADYGIHASVDGQKLETKYNTIKARYSSKYFGFGKGISAYTLFANCLPLCSKIIGANEHESHYLFDILNSNTTDVRVSAISGDMHSINKLNFALLHFFGYRFMPRFTRLDEKARANLVSFDRVENYKDYTIKPSKQVNTKLIIKEWDNILRIFTTLGLKKNTQSHIVRKLSAYKSNSTLRALVELNKIIMSLYILQYIDNEQIRKNVHRSLNRGESYHQLRSAIAKVSSRKLVGKTEKELTINNECARLLANCIIFYNASILSKLYCYYKSKKMIEECENIVRFSPVAWQHINLIGMYEFGDSAESLDLQGIVEFIINNLKIGRPSVS